VCKCVLERGREKVCLCKCVIEREGGEKECVCPK